VTRAEARERVLREARAMGGRDGAACRPPLTARHSGPYLVHRAALGAAIGPVRAADADAWGPGTVGAYGEGYAEASAGRERATREGAAPSPSVAASLAPDASRSDDPATARRLAIAAAVDGEPLPDTDQWRNRIEIRSESSSRVYVVAQRKASGEWACSCMGWKRHRHCKHLRVIAPLLGGDTR